jgi:hypothetical protein
MIIISLSSLSKAVNDEKLLRGQRQGFCKVVFQEFFLTVNPYSISKDRAARVAQSVQIAPLLPTISGSTQLLPDDFAKTPWPAHRVAPRLTVVWR